MGRRGRPFSRDPSRSRCLDPRAYVDEAFYERERETVFARSWKYAAHRSELSKPGSFVTISVAGESVVVMRREDGSVGAFYNVCQHRAHPLLSGSGCVGKIRCPYHAWTYRLDGSLASARHAEVEPEQFGLTPVPIEELCGFYFINLDPSAAPLSACAPGLEATLRKYVPDIDELEKVGVWTETRDCNWKLVIENDIECYHCPPTHKYLSARLNLKDYRSIDHGVFTIHVIEHGAERNVTHERDAFAYWYLWPDTEARVMPGPGNLAWYTMEPEGVGRTKLLYHHFLVPAAREATAEDVRHDPEDDPTVAEDVALVESVQRGLRSRGYRGGAFVVDRDSSMTEHSVHHFQSLVASAMAMSIGDDEVPVELHLEDDDEPRQLRARRIADGELLVPTPTPLATGTRGHVAVDGGEPHGFRVERLATPSAPIAGAEQGMVLTLAPGGVLTSDNDGSDLREGLSRERGKFIPTRYSYSDEGSRLFEELCEQPEYYLTRTERSILETHAADIVRSLGSCDLYELGAGNARKTRVLLRAAQRLGIDIVFYPTDVNKWILDKACAELAAELPEQRVKPVVATYDDMLDHLASTRGGDRPRVTALFGGSFGNYRDAERRVFLDRVRNMLGPRDRFLLASDLDKDTATLEAAYNDGKGVLATMELHVLSHLNELFDGDFDVSQFRHRSRHNRDQLRIESCVESLRPQTVTLRALDLTVRLEEGERICNDIMWKPTPEALECALRNSGLRCVEAWEDDNKWYTLRLLQA